MTVEECIDRMISRAALIMASPPPNYTEAKAGRDKIRADLQALVCTETERCLNVIEAAMMTADKARDTNGVYRLQNARDELLRTSPGEGDG